MEYSGVVKQSCPCKEMALNRPQVLYRVEWQKSRISHRISPPLQSQTKHYRKTLKKNGLVETFYQLFKDVSGASLILFVPLHHEVILFPVGHCSRGCGLYVEISEFWRSTKSLSSRQD